MRAITRWLIDRLSIDALTRFIALHKVPWDLEGRTGWLYVFGSATAAAFVVQLLTGIALATRYIASPANAHEVLVEITATWSGAAVRGMHFYGASAMVVLILVHAARTYLTAAYKFPRELNWITGVVLLVLTMAMAVTGQLLRWDQNGLWTVVVAAKFVARVPLIGGWLAEFVLAGPSVSGATLSRFYALHAIVLPAIMVGVLGVHLFLVAQHGVSELPKAGRPVDPKVYRRWYDKIAHREGVPYFPDVTWREAVASVAVVVVIATLTLIFGPQGPGPYPDPTTANADPRPDWFVRWYYALLWLKPRGLESFVMVYLPILVVIGLVALPLVAGRGERAPAKRPWAIGVVAFGALALVVLTIIGLRVPWSPHYGTAPLGPDALSTTDPKVLAGASTFHARGCQYCHRVLGRGGTYGPSLTDVTVRLSKGEITARTIVGYRDMPAYRDQLSAEELDAILAFLAALPSRAEASR